MDTEVDIIHPEVVTRLKNFGMSEDMISIALQIPLVNVKLTLAQQGYAVQTPEEEALADKTRQLIDRGLTEAFYIYDEGTAEAKLTLTRSVLGLAGKILGKPSEAGIEQGRKVLEDIFTKMREGDSIPVDA